MNPPLIIFGAGGHGRVVIEIARRSGLTVSLAVDDRATQPHLLNVPLVNTSNPRWLELSSFQFLVAIGDNSSRARIFNALLARGGEPINLIDPNAFLSSSVKIGRGNVFCPGSVINTEALIGDNCILNLNCSVDHDARIGSHSHIAPASVVGGRSKLGSFSLLGAAAVIPSGTELPDHTSVPPRSIAH
ncbi:MAG: hypothetical protein SFY81_15945 [Verrucomicrobiota bacterium]|nr:hypothetical protein [Verrucomicrobiota bacterium]